MLKDGVDGVDGLDGANSVTLSADGNHAYVTGQDDDDVLVGSPAIQSPEPCTTATLRVPITPLQKLILANL